MFNNLKIIISSKEEKTHLRVRKILSCLSFFDTVSGEKFFPHIDIKSLFDLNLAPENFQSSPEKGIKYHLLILEMDNLNLQYLQQIQLLHKIEPDLYIIIASKSTAHWREIIKFLGLEAKILFLKTPFQEEETLTLIKHACYGRWTRQFFNDYLFRKLKLNANSCNPISKRTHTRNKILDILSFEKLLSSVLSEGYIKRQNTALACLYINNVTSLKGEAIDYVTENLINDVKERLITYAPKEWHLVYWGKSKLGILVPQLTDLNNCERQLLALYNKLAEPYMIYGNNLIVSISIGVALSDTLVTSASELTTQAQNALKTSPLSHKKVPITFHNTYTAKKKMRSLMLEAELQEAIRQDQFEVYFQPIIDIQKNCVTALEILARWIHPKLGILLPNEFIPLANEANILTPISELILEKGMSIAKGWTEKGIKIAFNVTVDHLLSDGFLETLQRVCKRNKIPPSLIELEITEEQALENSLKVTHIINKIKHHGYHFVLDDFGVGYSSLHYLNSFPVDKVKIDRSFLLTSSPKQENIIKAIINLCQQLGIRTVCEGVESYQDYAFLIEAKCDEAQGFLFSHPLKAIAVDTFIDKFPLHIPAKALNIKGA